MAQPKSLHSFFVRFNLVKISDGSILVIQFGDFDWSLDDPTALYSGAIEVNGGLLDISGLKLEVGEPLPARSSGSITLNNTRGAYKNQYFRPSDLLKDYNIIDTDVFVFSFKTKPDELGSSADLRTEFFGKVKDVDFDPQSNQMRIAVESLPISTKFEQVAISPTTVLNLESGLEGKYLPICFGTPTIPGYTVVRSDYTAKVAFASYPTGYSNGDWISLYTPNIDNEYVSITDDGLPTPTIGSTSGVTYGRTLRAPYGGAATPTNSRSFRTRFTATSNYLLSAININLNNQTGASVTYNMIFACKIYRRRRTNDNDVEFQELSSGSVEFDAQVVANGANTSAEILLDKIIPLEINKKYFLEFTIAGNQNQTVDYEIDLIQRTETGSVIFRRFGNSQTYERFLTDRSFNFTGRCLRLDIQHSSNITQISITPATLPSGTDVAKFDDIKIVGKINGLIDDGSGTITGTINAPINDPYEVTRFLLRDQLSYLDTTTFDAANVVRTIAPRLISGYSKGRESNEQILAEVLKETACKLVPRNNGLSTQSWALYPYGYRSSSIRYLSEQQVRLIGYRQFGRDSVVNKIDIAYGESAIPQETSALQSGQPQRYTKFKTYDNTTGGGFTTWTTQSVANFGTRPNNNGWTTLSWVDDDATAEFYAQYLIQSYSQPKTIVELELPFFESDFRTIQCMDIIELSHPDMPATFGTSPDSLTPLPVYSGAVVETANFGFPFRQAQSYRLQVYSRQVIFNIGNNKSPVLRIACKVLNNPYEIY